MISIGSDIISFLKSHDPPQKEEGTPRKRHSAPLDQEKSHKSKVKDKDKDKERDKSKGKDKKDRSKDQSTEREDRSKEREERLSQRESATKPKKTVSEKELKIAITPEDFLKTDPSTPTKARPLLLGPNLILHLALGTFTSLLVP